MGEEGRMLASKLESTLSYIDNLLADDSPLSAFTAAALFVDDVLLRLKVWRDELEMSRIQALDRLQTDEASRGLRDLVIAQIRRIKRTVDELNTDLSNSKVDKDYKVPEAFQKTIDESYEILFGLTDTIRIYLDMSNEKVTFQAILPSRKKLAKDAEEPGLLSTMTSLASEHDKTNRLETDSVLPRSDLEARKMIHFGNRLGEVDYMTTGNPRQGFQSLSEHASTRKDFVTSDDGSVGNQKPSQREMYDDNENSFGMHIFVDKPANESGVVDFVALHGLNGHCRKTWTTTNSDGSAQTNWLKDLLPAAIPQARVISFGYNSVVQFSKGTAGITEVAEQLLEGLMAWRTSPEEKRRPVVFICHSLGGIVFKQAVVRARERDRFTQLLEYIRGVAFFGTPHLGTPSASFGAIFASILKISLLGVNTNAKLVSQLKDNVPTLLAINSSFVHCSENLAIISFYETEKMDYVNKLVVESNSAVMQVPNEISIGLNANHNTICKFLALGKNDEDFRMVSSALNGMVETILKDDVTKPAIIEY